MDVLYARKQRTLRAKLRIQSFPAVCSQVGWGGLGGLGVLAGGSMMALTACHREITATCLSVHNADGWPIQHGPARWSWPSLSCCRTSLTADKTPGRCRQGPEHCYLYRHQDLVCQEEKQEEMWSKERERVYTHFQKDHNSVFAKMHHHKQWRDLPPISEYLTSVLI